ncbi:MAG: sulfatase [Candidatus Bathyarchaeia archaeon]
MPYNRLIVIMHDTWRLANIGCYADAHRSLFPKDWIRTPHLDELASESIVFEDGFAEALPTVQVRKAFFTGKRVFPYRRYQEWFSSRDAYIHRMPGWQPLQPDDITLTEILKMNRYVTGTVTDTSMLYFPAFNFHRAFDTWHWVRGKDMWYRIPLEGPRSFLRGGYLTPTYGKERAPLDKIYSTHLKETVHEEDFYSAQTYRNAVKWLDDNYWRDKWFLYIDEWDPHEPWWPPQSYVDMYDPGYEYENIEELEKMSWGIPDKGEVWTERQERHIRALYAGMCTYADRWLGYLLDKVKLLGLMEDTVIVFTCDHGTLMGEHDGSPFMERPYRDSYDERDRAYGSSLWEGKIFGKPSWPGMYDYIVRVPLMIRLPDQSHAGKRVKGFWQHHDIAPTILSLLGIKTPSYMEGKDLMPLVTGEAEKMRGHIVCGYGNTILVRDDRWHYVTMDRRQTKYPKGRDMLFDMKNDPLQMKNVIDEHPEVVKEGNERIKGLFEDYNIVPNWEPP